MLDTFLVPAKTTVSAKGDGPSVDVGSALNTVLLATLDISNIVEQESLDVSIYASADGTTWFTKPVASFPQQFYRGQTPLLVDLSQHPESKFLRAHWEVARWGRGTETPMFEFQVTIKQFRLNFFRKRAPKLTREGNATSFLATSEWSLDRPNLKRDRFLQS